MLLEFEDERLLEDVVISQPILVLVRFLVFETNRMFFFPWSDVVLKARKRLGLKMIKAFTKVLRTDGLAYRDARSHLKREGCF